jgi:hypothetical protein
MFDHASMQRAAGERGPCRDVARAGSRRSSRATVDNSVSFTPARSEAVQRSISAFWLQADPNSRL